MTIPFDQKLAKLRLLERRAEVEHDKAHAEFERIKDEAWKPVYEARERLVRVQMAYLERARELGYCGNCEKLLTECQCVTLAKAVLR